MRVNEREHKNVLYVEWPRFAIGTLPDRAAKQNMCRILGLTSSRQSVGWRFDDTILNITTALKLLREHRAPVGRPPHLTASRFTGTRKCCTAFSHAVNV